MNRDTVNMQIGSRRLYDRSSHGAIQTSHSGRQCVIKQEKPVFLLLFILRHKSIRSFITLLCYLGAFNALQAIQTLYTVRLNISRRKLLDHIQILALDSEIRLQTIHAGRFLYQLLAQTGAIPRQDITQRGIDNQH